MAPKRYSIYASPALDRVLTDRLPTDSESEGFRSRSSMISAIADRYAEIVRRAIPDLTTAEWCLLFDTLNSTWTLDDAALTAQGIAHNVADGATLDGLGEKWGVDGLDLARRIEALPFAAKVGIIDTVERFWSLGVKEGEDYAGAIQRIIPRQRLI
jgi:hypothetical protein